MSADHALESHALAAAVQPVPAAAERALEALLLAAAAACQAPLALLLQFDAQGVRVRASLGWSGPAAWPMAQPANAARAPSARQAEKARAAYVDRLVPTVRRLGAAEARCLACQLLLGPSGEPLGALVVLDHRARRLAARQQEVLRHLGVAAQQALERPPGVPHCDVTGPARGAVPSETEYALMQERQRLGSLIEGTRAGTWEWNLQTGELKLSPRCAAMLGRSQLEFDAIGIDTGIALTHPDDRAVGQAALSSHLRGTDSHFACEVRLRHGDGHWLWVRESGRLLTRTADGRAEWLFGILQDISDQRAVQAEAQRNAQVLLSAIDALDEAFVLYDPQDRLVLCNEKYRTLYAESADLLVPGMAFEDIVRQGALRGQYAEAVGRVEAWVAERMAAHRSGNTTLIQKLGNGRTLRIIERKTPDGHLVGFRIDITDLVRATERAEAGNRAKGEFIATVSHELRTPLTSIIGFAELGVHFAQTRGEAQYEKMFGRVHRAGQRMLALVNDLLDLSDRGANEQPVNLQFADLGVLLGDVLSELQPQWQARALAIDGPAQLPHLPVRVDALRLQQVLRNVLANAIRFSPQGSRLFIEGALIPGNDAQGGTPTRSCRVELSVRDQGPGIPADELEAIFEPFVQSSRTRDGSGGTGLGLAICRRLMAAHGGTIHAENAAGGGACIRLRLPCISAASSSAQAAAQEATG
jgi:PAS domain S-box-containing protein